MSLVEHHRIAGRAGSANDPQRRPDERALEDLLVDARLGVDVLQVPDAPAGLHLRVAGHREVGPLLPRGLRVARRRIAHGQRDVPRGQVLAGALRPKPGSPWSKRSRAALRWAECLDLDRALRPPWRLPAGGSSLAPG